MEDYMNQITRLNKYEKILNNYTKIINRFKKEYIKYQKIQSDLSALTEYYQSQEWLHDFEDYEKGHIDKSVHVGILSEDAIYNLLDENREIAKELHELSKNILKKCE